MEVLNKPLTKKQIRSKADRNGCISGIVPFNVHNIINNDYQGFLEQLSETMVGTKYTLSNITFKVVGAIGNDILFEINGIVMDLG